jgi:hypothetical protein
MTLSKIEDIIKQGKFEVLYDDQHSIVGLLYKKEIIPIEDKIYNKVINLIKSNNSTK